MPYALGIHLHRLYPRQELCILHANQIRTLVLTHHLEGDELITGLIILQAQALGLGVEVVVEQRLGQYGSHLLAGIGVVGLHGNVINLGSYAEGGI